MGLVSMADQRQKMVILLFQPAPNFRVLSGGVPIVLQPQFDVARQIVDDPHVKIMFM